MLRMGNQHNDDNAVHKKTTFADNVISFRRWFVHEGKKWTPESRKKALVGINIQNPTKAQIKSSNELFRIASVADPVWEMIYLLLKGQYLQLREDHVNLVCVNEKTVPVLTFLFRQKMLLNWI